MIDDSDGSIHRNNSDYYIEIEETICALSMDCILLIFINEDK